MNARRIMIPIGLLSGLLSGCGSEEMNLGAAMNLPSPPLPGPWDKGVVLPEPLRGVGDPVRGRDLLLNGNYMSCGIPYKLWNFPIAAPIVQKALGQGRERFPELGRTGKNAEMPYGINVFKTTDGAEVMNLNCLHCHGGYFDGKLVVGLGDPTRDFTDGLIGNIPVDLLQSWMLSPILGFSKADRANTEKILDTARAIGNRTMARTVGNNPADSLAVVLAEHRNFDLSWSEAQLRQIDFYNDDGSPRKDTRFTSDPPPWWRAHKKNSLFYNGMTRGYHRGTMSAASAICVDNIPEAERIDALFADIQAYVETVRAPRYPYPIDSGLAQRGKELFTRTCAGCHGTYAEDPQDDAHDTYPNLIIPKEVIGTDPMIADIGTIHARDGFRIWNQYFYGRITQLAPGSPVPGYVAPPLDGIWATAPFLHNGSVPNLELLLNSRARPRYWKRVDYDSRDFDQRVVGWPFTEVAYGQDAAPAAERKYIYDTTQWSQGNGGHTFGDAFTTDERRAVIEYLKTL